MTRETREQLLKKRIREEILNEMKAEKEKSKTPFERFLATTEQTFREAKDADIQTYLKNKQEGTSLKSYELLKTLREFLQVSAYKGKSDASLLTTTYLTGKAVSTIMSTMDYLRDTAFLTSATLVQENVNWKLQYQLDDESINNGARRILNEKYGLDIPMLHKESETINESRFNFDDLHYDEAGFVLHQ